MAAPLRTSGAAPRRPRAFASPRMIDRLSRLLLYIGVIGAVWGVTYDINGATRAGGDVEVAVQAGPEVILAATGATSEGANETVLVQSDLDFYTGIDFSSPGAPGLLVVPDNVFQMSVWESTMAEQLLNRGHFAVLGICLLLGAVLLRRLIASINQGDPFRRGNAARVAGIAGLVALNAVAQFLPSIASNMVLERVGLTGGPLSPAPIAFPFASMLITALLLVLAEVFRRGHDLAKDVDGLV